MNQLYLKYFANVRWVELILAFAVAVITNLQLSLNAGGKLDQATVLKALGVGAGVAWAYLRMPKDTTTPVDEPQIVAGGVALPPGVDATGPADDVAAEVIQEALHALLLPIVGTAAPTIATNATKELSRFVKRGIHWGGHWKL